MILNKYPIPIATEDNIKLFPQTTNMATSWEDKVAIVTRPCSVRSRLS